MRKTLILVSFLAVAACGSLEQEVANNQCDAALWHSFGFQDGVRGVESSGFGKRNADCNETATEMRRERYMAGYGDGVTKFCTAENGYNQGVTGYVYKGICPIELEDGFVKALKDGHSAAKAQKVAGKL